MGITIRICPNCLVTVEDNRVRWICDDYHPEVLRVTGNQSVSQEEVQFVEDEPCIEEDNATEPEIMIMNTTTDTDGGHVGEDVYRG